METLAKKASTIEEERASVVRAKDEKLAMKARLNEEKRASVDAKRASIVRVKQEKLAKKASREKKYAKAKPTCPKWVG